MEGHSLRYGLAVDLVYYTGFAGCFQLAPEAQQEAHKNSLLNLAVVE